MPPVHDGAGIDGHDLAGPDRPLARDPVDDLVIDADADAGRERPARVDARIALERRGRARRADVRLGETVEVAGGDAGLQFLLHEREDLGHDPAGLAHLLDLGAGLPRDHGQPATTGSSDRAARIAAVTVSTGATPST